MTTGRIIIFGAAGHVGCELAHMLAARGCAERLVLVDHKAEPLEKCGTELKAHVMVKDVMDEKQCKDVFDMHRDEGIEAVVSMVTGDYEGPKPMATIDAACAEQYMRKTLLPAWNILKGATDAMHASGKGGSIVFVGASVGAEHGLKNHELFGAAKAAVEGMCTSAAATWAPHNIRVNVVAPGLIASPKAEAAVGVTSPEAMEKLVDLYPLRRIAQPREVAAAVAFLIQPEASFITGQTLCVDGGMSTLTPHMAIHHHDRQHAAQQAAAQAKEGMQGMQGAATTATTPAATHAQMGTGASQKAY